MSKFIIPVIFSFEGNATVTAENREEAINTIFASTGTKSAAFWA